MRSVWLWLLTIALAACVGGARAQDAGTLERIDAFVAQQVADSGLPGVAIVVLQDNRAPHVRGFGDDGAGQPISADTPSGSRSSICSIALFATVVASPRAKWVNGANVVVDGGFTKGVHY